MSNSARLVLKRKTVSIYMTGNIFNEHLHNPGHQQERPVYYLKSREDYQSNTLKVLDSYGLDKEESVQLLSSLWKCLGVCFVKIHVDIMNSGKTTRMEKITINFLLIHLITVIFFIDATSFVTIINCILIIASNTTVYVFYHRC